MEALHAVTGADEATADVAVTDSKEVAGIGQGGWAEGDPNLYPKDFQNLISTVIRNAKVAVVRTTSSAIVL
jgi:hypothetical protein